MRGLCSCLSMGHSLMQYCTPLPWGLTYREGLLSAWTGTNTAVQPMIRGMPGVWERPHMGKPVIWELPGLPTPLVLFAEMEHVVRVSPVTTVRKIAALATRDVLLHPLRDVGAVRALSKLVN